MKAVVGAFNQEKALVGAFSVIVQPVVEPMDRITALVSTLLSPAGAACFTSEGNCQHWTAYGQPPAAWQGKEATSYPPNQYWQLGVQGVVAWWHTLDMWSSKNALSSYACLSYPHVSIMLYATLLSNLFLDVVLNLV